METDKKTLQNNSMLAYLGIQFRNGLRSIRESKIKTILALCFLLVAVAGLFCVTTPTTDRLTHLLQPLAAVLYIAVAALAGIAAIVLPVIPKGVCTTAQAAVRAHVVNAAGEPPLLLKRHEDKETGGSIIELYSPGIPMSVYQDRAEPLGSAMNRRITRIAQGDDVQTVTLHLAPGGAKLPDSVYLPQSPALSPSKFILGMSLDGLKIWDMNTRANALIGGSTGCGKTTLELSIAVQCLNKKDEDGRPAVDLSIIDMKGGTNYPYFIRQACDFANDHASALTMLSMKVQELERRKIMFAQLADFERLPIDSMEEYNRRHPENKLRRQVIMVDELADLTQTYPGMDKAAKERVGTINDQLERLARQGRGFGITLIVSLQRPDSNALNGAIKNNLNLIIAGKSQPVLSQILLGNNDAWDKIPSDERGLFLTDEGTLFRGFLLPPELIAPDNYKPRPRADQDTTNDE